MNDAQLACACATARHAARVLTQLYDGILRDVGLEAPQFALLLTLDRSGPSNQMAVANRLGLDKTTVSRNVRWLERQGWIAAAPGATRRERQLTLTAEGRKRLAAAKPRWKHAQDRLRVEMGGKDWAAMFRIFRTVTDAAHRARRPRRTTGDANDRIQ